MSMFGCKNATHKLFHLQRYGGCTQQMTVSQSPLYQLIINKLNMQREGRRVVGRNAADHSKILNRLDNSAFPISYVLLFLRVSEYRVLQGNKVRGTLAADSMVAKFL